MSGNVDVSTRIEEGSCAVLRKLNGSKLTLTRVKRNLGVSVENLKFRLDNSLIGKLYGIYNVKNGVLSEEATAEEISDYKNICASTVETDEIDGERANQTNLVREKVQIKQAKRALTLVQIEKANPRLLSELFYLRNPETVGYLRADHISYIMEISGIIQGSRVLIFDQCSGVLTSHVVERLGGEGHCVLLHSGATTVGTISCFNNCQFPKKIANVLRTVPVKRLLESTKDVEMPLNEEEKQNGQENNSKELEDEALSWFETEGFPDFGRFDSLLIICRNADPCSVLDKTLTALRSSGTIVIYSPNSAVISAARTYLEQKACVFTNIRSSRHREIQVLKHRTHPLMQQIIPGGFILSGIRCYNP